jgi:O-acetylhomoserine (thiol)-lyase
VKFETPAVHAGHSPEPTTHAKVGWVNYAGLEDHRDHALAKKHLGGKPSGILTFGVQSGYEGGARLQDALKLITRLVKQSLACPARL